ncbi:MAG: hypothetical protein LUC94_06950, partial [Clostridiales bacterium]|nr:hypothetical protein [Clostridiales bacterium]
ILQSLTTLLIQRNYTSGLNNFDSLKSKLEGIADNLYSEVSTIPFNKSDSLYGGFYLYLYMLTIYNEYAKDKEIEENALEEIYGENLYNKKSNISDEYSFFDKGGALLPSANIEKTDKEKFHLGDKTCTQETFEKRLEFCRKFIEFYNQKTPRYLDAKNISVLRAVYKTFYISGLTYKDKSIYTLAKDLMKSNDYSMLMLNHHVIGAVINRENYCEMRNGIDIYKAVAMLSKPINKIFLYTFYRDCPRLEDTSIEDYLCRLKGIFKTVKNRIYLELL